MKPDTLKLLRYFPRVGALAVAGLGISVLAGWALHSPVLKSVIPGHVSMKINTAISFTLAGLALWCLRTEGHPGLRMKLGRLLGLGVLTIGTLTQVEYAFSVDLGIDEFFMKDEQGLSPLIVGGRMAPATALCFVLLGVAIVSLDGPDLYGRVFARFLAVVVFVLSAIALAGYGYGVESFYSMGIANSMAVHTSVAFMISSMVLLTSRPDRGILKIMLSNTSGGSVARRLFVVIPVVLGLLGWVCIRGVNTGLYDYHFAFALMAVLSVLAAASLVAWQARTLYRIEMAGYDLQKSADTDPLTGLLNRRAMTRRLDEEWQHARRYHGALSLVMIDIDHFKSFNDEFGHPAGDDALREFAVLLAAHGRGIDSVARYGGEEFMIILPGTDETGAMIFSERLREKIEGAAFPKRRMTASLGVATFRGEDGREAGIEELIGEADRALYAAKSHGRNRVIHYRQFEAAS